MYIYSDAEGELMIYSKDCFVSAISGYKVLLLKKTRILSKNMFLTELAVLCNTIMLTEVCALINCY